MQTAPPNLLADYLYLRQTAVVKQAIDTARTSVPSGGHSSSYLCQQDSVFAAQDRPLCAGLTLGGGFGWLMGKYGLALDNLRSVELVTAEGRVLRASAEEHPDLRGRRQF